MSRFALSAAGERITVLTGVRAIMKDIAETARSRGGQLINLGAGNPLVVPAVARLWQSCLEELVSRPDELAHLVGRYGDSQGVGSFVRTVAAYFNRTFGWPVTERNVLITPGSQSIYFYAANLFCGLTAQGGEQALLLPLDPDYTGYASSALGSRCVRSLPIEIELLGPHEFRYRLNLAALDAITQPIGAMVFSRPSNPTGRMLTDAELGALVDWAAAREVPAFVDCAYNIPFPALVARPPAMPWRDGLVYCFSLSKAGLPGERLGIAIGPADTIELMECFQSNANIHSSRLGQALAERALAGGTLPVACQRALWPLYHGKFERLRAMLDAGMPECRWYLHEHEGTLFAWLWLPDLPRTSVELYDLLKAEGLIVVPGSMFFHDPGAVDPDLTRCVRISLTASDEELERGAGILMRVLRGLTTST